MERSSWKTPQDVKSAHPKASILKSGRVVFNIKANDYRLIALVRYAAGVVMTPSRVSEVLKWKARPKHVHGAQATRPIPHSR